MTPSDPPSPVAPRQVLLFSGHRVDAPGRAPPRFPPALVPRAAAAIGAALDALGAGAQDLAFTQAASGGDLLFAEACAARGVRVRVLLPVDEAAFIAASVCGSAGTEDWPARYAGLRARLVEPPRVMNESIAARFPQADAFERCNAWLLESAAAFGIDRLHFVCLWDGSTEDDASGPGGTAHMVREVARLGAPVTWIDTRTLAAPGAGPSHELGLARPGSGAHHAAHPPQRRVPTTAAVCAAEEHKGHITMVTKTSAAARARGLSLNLGLNAVSAAAYAGWDGPLAACEFDANDMATIAKSIGAKSTLLLTKKATRANVLAGMRAAAKALKAGDFFLLTYSGHGGQVPDTNGDEPDGKDETWCLHDGQLIDDELYLELSRFAAGVRILVLSDSCHSGTITRDLPPPPPPPGQRIKLMPDAVARRVYDEHRAFYDKLQADVVAAARKARSGQSVDPDAALANVGAAHEATALVGQFNPAVVLISGCQDNQTSMDGQHNGAFTEQLLKVWDRGAFVGDYNAFHGRIRAAMPSTQSPNLFVLGKAAAFLKQKPFTV